MHLQCHECLDQLLALRDMATMYTGRMPHRARNHLRPPVQALPVVNSGDVPNAKDPAPDLSGFRPYQSDPASRLPVTPEHGLCSHSQIATHFTEYNNVEDNSTSCQLSTV